VQWRHRLEPVSERLREAKDLRDLRDLRLRSLASLPWHQWTLPSGFDH
jgi:hypothetical protein